MNESIGEIHRLLQEAIALLKSGTKPDRERHVVTCPAKEMVSEIHDRMPVLLAPDVHERWLSAIDHFTPSRAP